MSSLTIVQFTCKQKISNSKDTSIQKRFKRVMAYEISFKSNSNSCKCLQYKDFILQVLEIAVTSKTTEITIFELMKK